MLLVALSDNPFCIGGTNQVLEDMFGDVLVSKMQTLDTGTGSLETPSMVTDRGVEEALAFDSLECFEVAGGATSGEVARASLGSGAAIV